MWHALNIHVRVWNSNSRSATPSSTDTECRASNRSLHSVSGNYLSSIYTELITICRFISLLEMENSSLGTWLRQNPICSMKRTWSLQPRIQRTCQTRILRFRRTTATIAELILSSFPHNLNHLVVFILCSIVSSLCYSQVDMFKAQWRPLLQMVCV